MKTALLVSISATELSADEATLLRRINPLGVTLFGRNINNPTQLSKLIDDLYNILGENTIIAIDQEGGRVRRLREPHWRSYASQYVLGQLPPSVSGLQAELIAEDLKRLKINFNYAPVLDTLYPQTHSVLKSRCFAENIAECGRNMIDGYCRNGVCPCIKHIPGHGRAVSDSHLGLPVINEPWDKLQSDMQPFRANNKAPTAMTAHIVWPEIDNLPITMSAKAIDYLIRGYIGFDGLLISDAIEMNALQGTITERTETALKAGCDVVCYCRGQSNELAELANLSPQISEKTYSRLETVWKIINRRPVDVPNYRQYAELVGRITAYDETYDATETLNLMNRKENRNE